MQDGLLEEFGCIDEMVREVLEFYIEGWAIYHKPISDTKYEIMIVGPSKTPWTPRWLWNVLWPVTKMDTAGRRCVDISWREPAC